MRKCRQRGGSHLARTRLSVNDVRNLVEAQQVARSLSSPAFYGIKLNRNEVVERWRGVRVLRTTYAQMYKRGRAS